MLPHSPIKPNRPLALLVSAVRVLLLLSSPARVSGGRCVSALHEIGQPVGRIRTLGPLGSFDAAMECWHQSRKLLFAIENMTTRERALCGVDILVPFDETIDPLMKFKDDDDFHKVLDVTVDSSASPVAALNLTTGRWHYVGANHTFDCVLCQREDVQLRLQKRELADAVAATYSAMSRFQVNVTSVDARVSGNVSAEEVLEVRKALTQLLQPHRMFSATAVVMVPDVYHSSLKDDKLLLEFRMLISILKSVAASSQIPLLGKYLVSVDEVSLCPQEETVDADGRETVWPITNSATSQQGKFQMAINSSTNLILRRDCNFDDSIYRATWNDVSFWQLEWRECSDDEQFVSEEIYKEFLGEEILYKHNHQLQGYASAVINSTELKMVTRIVNRQVDLTNDINDIMARDLVNITANLLLGDDEDVCLVQDTRVYVLVAALEGKTPVVGLTVEYKDGTDAGNVNITLDRSQTEKPRRHQQFALAISDGLVTDHKRMMVFVYWMDIPYVPGVLRSERRTSQYNEVTVALVLKSEQKFGALNYGGNSDYFVDLTFKPHSDTFLATVTVMKCSAWNDQLDGWVTEGCHPLKANRGNLTVCRCSAKYFTLADASGVATARFALNRAFDELQTDLPFTAFFGDNTALVAATVAECLLSALGLCSIVATAILFKAWRQNTGHQILMHMMLALTCNLVLGFVTTFVHLSTESAGCVLLGVLRHYSFLAMFLWMLVLSGLQRKRLTTVAGTKAVTHLILKASAFAWGVPVVPIIILLAWNTRFYQYDRFDRGYCYPEGLVFQLTVQVPAGVILLVNLGIFINIVAHIFECQGGKKITRHSKNKRVEQLNKLKTSLFIFFLFGFTWVFHFMSELRIISSDFLFEYMFLMTATTHVLVLALFFIVLQGNTRKDWFGLFRKLRYGSKPMTVASVVVPQPSYQPRLPKAKYDRAKKVKKATNAV